MQGPRGGRPTALRRGVGLCIAVAATASLGVATLAVGGGDDASPTLTIAVGGSGNPQVSGADGLQAGFTEVTLRNTGRAPAFTIVARLKPGTTIAELRRATSRSRNIPGNLIALPTSDFLNPGQTYRVTVRLDPGDYLAVQAPDGRGLGKFTRFTVGTGRGDRTPPEAGARITMYDHGFRVPARIPGRGTLAIRNIGANFHFIAGIRLNPGVDARQVARIFRGEAPEPEGPPPGEFVSIVGLVGPDVTNYVETDLRPGRYVIACFFADRKSGGREHSEFGMVRIVTIT